MIIETWQINQTELRAISETPEHPYPFTSGQRYPFLVLSMLLLSTTGVSELYDPLLLTPLMLDESF